MSILFRYETPKDKARAFMDECGLVQKKAVDGFPLPMLVRDYHETRGDASAVEEQGESPPLTTEKVLEVLGKWYALDPTNEAILVGLRRFQRVTYRDIYRELRGEPDTHLWESQRQVIVRIWSKKFLALAKSRGLSPERLQKLVNQK